MSSETSYCPALRGSCGGGYEGGVHLFTPEKAGAKRSKTGVGWAGEGTRRQRGGHKAREEEKRWMAKRETSSVNGSGNGHNNTTPSHANGVQAHGHTVTFLHIKPEI